MSTMSVYRSAFSSDALATQGLLAALNQGPLLVNYIGHGSEDRWNGIFDNEDAAGLLNGQRLSFFVNMTCLTGTFDDIYMDPLAEALLTAPNGGALAVWASSGLTEPGPQVVMNEELIRQLFNGQGLTIGQAIARAKAATTDPDVRRIWILLGDPATRLKQIQ
jgi:hypothetical protein